MARRPPSRPGLRLGVLAVILVAMYAGMLGSGHLKPNLGLDLRGGTQVILTPQKTNGVTANKAQLTTAVNIIRQRVDGLGVAGASVETQGNNVVIAVPGKGRNDVLDQVGQTAALSFREIYTDPKTGQPYEANNPAPPTKPTPSTSASPTGAASPGSSGSPTSSPTAPASGSSGTPHASTATSPAATATTHNRPLSDALRAASPSPTPPAPTTAGPAPSVSAPVGVVQSASAAPTTKAPPEANQTAPSAAVLAQFQALDCSKNDGRPEHVDEDPHHFVVACDRTGKIKYLLKPADLVGTQVSSAVATIGQTPQGQSTGLWEVDVSFKDSAVKQVETISTRLYNNNHQQLAITLDGVVVSAPSTNGVLGKNITISGGTPPFTQKEATNLANALKYGSLPVSFARSSVESVSASLGKSSLHAGLLAGAFGLLLVLIYVFIYYRMLGFVTVVSLVTSGLLVYASVVLLGQAIGYTLSLAGIAGLIVAIGITADSFVVYFERLKDEIREGRVPRLAVEYGWKTAWRTILSADVISFLAAVVLYLVSVGDVKGFAFTLGLSTVLDIVVVQLFTKPLITLLIRFPIFSTSKFSGLHPGSIGHIAAKEA
ncbi:MAG TPA: protein translocase subunit SecD [Mycobacteriales bacterium]